MRVQRPRLELTLIASGATQHVFERSASEEWVYKIPACIDELLPTPPVLGRFTPAGKRSRLVYRNLYEVPRSRWRDHRDDTISTRYAERFSLGCARLYVALGNRLLATYLRRARSRAFAQTLRLHRVLAGRLPDEELPILPFEILPRIEAILHADGVRRGYRGPVLVQKRAEHFFERCQRLDAIDPGALVAAQEALWQQGIAIADVAGVLGPDGWALLEGRVYLADTGSLTDRYELACATLDPPRLVRFQERRLRRRTDERVRRRVATYYEFVRARLTRERLAALWCVGRRGGL